MYSRKHIFVFEEVHLYAETNSIATKPGSGCLSKVTAEIKNLFEQQMIVILLYGRSRMRNTEYLTKMISCNYQLIYSNCQTPR